MELIDTHCHIQSAGLIAGEHTTRDLWAKAPDLTQPEIIQAAHKAGITKMIAVGCTLADSQLAIACAGRNKNVYASIGIHPHEAKDYQDKAELEQFAQLLNAKPLAGEEGADTHKNNKIVAIGECGLDYFYNHSPGQDQIKVLKFQIELALEHDLPLIFHVREAFEDFWPVFEQYKGVRGVLHSYTDNQANLDKAVQSGLYVGVNGIATFAKNEAQLAVYKAIPINNLLLETDAPFLTPVPQRGTICEPKHVRFTAEFLAKLRGDDFEELAKQTTANANKLFGI